MASLISYRIILLSWRILLLILPNLFNFYFVLLISLAHNPSIFSFVRARLTGGSLVCKCLLLLFFRRGFSGKKSVSLSLSLSSLLERWKVKRSEFLGELRLICGCFSAFYSLCGQSELSLPSFSRLGRKKSWGSLLEMMILAPAVLNLRSEIFFFSIVLYVIISLYLHKLILIN